MAQVTLTIHGTPYKLACNDGEEENLARLAAEIDRKVGEVFETVGNVGEAKLLLMAALLMLDEVRGGKAPAQAPPVIDITAQADTLDTMAGQIDSIAERVKST
jgi:cell division protein ZapA